MIKRDHDHWSSSWFMIMVHHWFSSWSTIVDLATKAKGALVALFGSKILSQNFWTKKSEQQRLFGYFFGSKKNNPFATRFLDHFWSSTRSPCTIFWRKIKIKFRRKSKTFDAKPILVIFGSKFSNLFRIKIRKKFEKLNSSRSYDQNSDFRNFLKSPKSLCCSLFTIVDFLVIFWFKNDGSKPYWLFFWLKNFPKKRAAKGILVIFGSEFEKTQKFLRKPDSERFWNPLCCSLFRLFFVLEDLPEPSPG